MKVIQVHANLDDVVEIHWTAGGDSRQVYTEQRSAPKTATTRENSKNLGVFRTTNEQE